MPLVADPGFRLGRDAQEAGYAVSVAPGPSAVLAALAVSGLASDRFTFAGFAPAARGARKTWLAELRDIPSTMIFFESPKRVGEMLKDLCDSFGGEREAALCRELTKRFEEVRRGSLSDLAAEYAQTPPRGEVVLVVDRAAPVVASEADIRAALQARAGKMSRKDAASEVAALMGLPRRQVYQLALAMDPT